MQAIAYRCINCNDSFSFDELLYTCPKCNSNLQIEYDYEKIKFDFSKEDLKNSNDFSIWRYLPLYPVKTRIDLPKVGWTPLYKTDKLGSLLGFKNLFVKDDGKNPSASFKDRASSIVLSKALESNIKVITGASTGNAGSSTACLASALGIKTIIFVPRKAPKAKVAQLLIFGSTVISVNGTYDNAFDLCLKASKEFGWYSRNTGYNPFTREGKKSVSFEICEQMDWEVPDIIFVPVGDGNIISGVWKGFKDLYNIGFIKKLPRLIAVQAEKSNAISQAFLRNSEIKEVSGDTIADSISVSIPRDGQSAVIALKESNGNSIEINDKEILEAIPIIAKNTGIFVEPAAAITYAGLQKALEKQIISKDEKILLLFTGNGLKDIDNALKVAGNPLEIENNFSELEKVLKF